MSQRNHVAVWYTRVMVKKKIEKKLKQDPVSVIIVILVFTALLLGVLVYMHVAQANEIDQLRSDLNREIQLREVR